MSRIKYKSYVYRNVIVSIVHHVQNSKYNRTCRSIFHVAVSFVGSLVAKIQQNPPTDYDGRLSAETEQIERIRICRSVAI